MAAPFCWFEQLDRLRKAQGNALDRLGLGPQETAYRVVFERPGLRLRLYGTETGLGPPLLIVPAPIKRPYIWDLSPQCSVVRRALEHQLVVYLVEWTEPERQTQAAGLADYAGDMLDDCMGAIREQTGYDKAFLTGHSLGGVFTALHGAYRPGQVAALVLVDVPLHFAGTADSSVRTSSAASNIPGSLLSMASARAAPATFCTSRYLDCLASMASNEQTLSHWRVERWTLDEFAMSRALFNDVVDDLYRHNRFMRGELAIGNIRLHPHKVNAPLLSIYQPAGGVVPVESVLAFHRAAGSAHKELVPYFGDTGIALQHVGPLVGANAHRHLWPRVFAWLERMSALDVAVREPTLPADTARVN